MNVLSLFDGMSCGQIALQRLGKKVDKYYASEIDKHAIKATQFNFPNTIQLGSVTEVKAKDLDRIDLLIGGSPCQGFSTAGKRLNFEDPRSKLFFEFVRLLEECREINPDIKFMLENVRMKEEHENVISKFLGVNAIVINSSLVSAQNRVRLYWTNIGQQPAGLFGDMESIIPQPKDRGIVLKDILQEEVDEKYYLSDKALARIRGASINERGIRFHQNDAAKSGISELGRVHTDKTDKTDTIIASHQPKVMTPKQGGTGLLTREDGKVYCLDTNTNTIEVIRKIDIHGKEKLNQDKASTFTAGGNSGGNHSDMDLLQIHVRKVIQLSDSKESGGKQPYQQNRVYNGNALAPANQAQLPNGSYAFHINDRIRRLTPIECCRLQTVPDDYFTWATAISPRISENQQYRMLGNGWTIDVICHILSFLR